MTKSTPIVAIIVMTLAGFATAEPEGKGKQAAPSGPGNEHHKPCIMRPEAGRPMQQWPGMERKGGMEDEEIRESFLMRVLNNPELVGKIGLSEDQVAMLKDAFYDIRKQEIKFRAEQELAGLEQAKLITARKPDEKQIMKAVETAGKIEIEIAKLRIKKVLLVKTSLTPEQMAKVQNLLRDKIRERRDQSGSRESPIMGGGRNPAKMKEHLRELREKRREDRDSKNAESQEDQQPVPSTDSTLPPPPTPPSDAE